MARLGVFECDGVCGARILLVKWGLMIFNVAFWVSEHLHVQGSSRGMKQRAYSGGSVCAHTPVRTYVSVCRYMNWRAACVTYTSGSVCTDCVDSYNPWYLYVDSVRAGHKASLLGDVVGCIITLTQGEGYNLSSMLQPINLSSMLPALSLASDIINTYIYTCMCKGDIHLEKYMCISDTHCSTGGEHIK